MTTTTVTKDTKKRITLDIETTSKWDHIWMCVTQDIDTGEMLCHTKPETLSSLIDTAELVIGHNLLAFDSYLLQKLWKVSIPLSKCYDTLIASRLMRPDMVGGHSLEQWALRLKTKKGDYNEWDNPDLVKMEEYCRQDVTITTKLYYYLVTELKRLGFSDYSVELEHKVAAIISEQIRYGVLIDERKLMGLLAEANDALGKIEATLVQTMEPTIVKMKTKTKVIPFNPGSRQQIIDRLQRRGWVPTDFTENGNVILNEEVIEHLEFPEAKLFKEFFEIQNVRSFINNWNQRIKVDGRIHGTVISNGAVTGRMTHSNPNLGNVPSVKSEWGARCREVFIPPKGYKMVGVDADGLELRMMAHYMKDEDYIDAVHSGKKEDGTDVHTVNQKAAGLSTRDVAKTFIYAFLYGAGAEKIGKIAGTNADNGQKLIDRFLGQTPALKDLRKTVADIAKKGSVPGLDGRRIRIREPHKAVNALLQGAGAIVMKQALVLLNDAIQDRALDAKFVLNVHDEFQLEVREDQAEEVGKLAVWSIEEAGRVLKLRCPLAAQYKIGNNWRETH